MSVALIIPARHASSRYPGKPLAMLRGAGGEAKSLIRRSWEAALAIEGVDTRAIATDDERIADAARALGAPVLMTSPQARNGTERCAEAAAALDPAPEIVVNLQGDAPLTPAWFVPPLVAALREDPGLDCATPVLACSGEMAERLRADRRAGRVGATTAVFGADGRALYFSKEVIPFGAATVHHHVGVYAYRRAALDRYAALPQGILETSEGLEQLRFLEAGRPVACVLVEDRGAPFWELNNPEDVPVIEAMLAERGIA